MKQDKDKLKLPPVKIGGHPDLDFSESPKLRRPKKRRKARKFWDPFESKSRKPKKSGSSYYRRQIRSVKRDVGL